METGTVPARLSKRSLSWTAAACLAAACLLLSCTRHVHTERFGYLTPPPNEKNIVMPSVSSDFTEKLAEALRAKGWNTLETTPTESGTESGTPDATAGAPGTIAVPYTLQVHAKFLGKCVTWDNFIEYEIRVIDNNTGKTLFTMNGRRCASKVVQQFMRMMEARNPT